MTSVIKSAVDSMSHWRDRVVNPWRHNKIIYTDAELENIIDKIFSLFSTISPAENSVIMTVSRFLFKGI